jgi:hypothetical protein
MQPGHLIIIRTSQVGCFLVKQYAAREGEVDVFFGLRREMWGVR